MTSILIKFTRLVSSLLYNLLGGFLLLKVSIAKSQESLRTSTLYCSQGCNTPRRLAVSRSHTIVLSLVQDQSFGTQQNTNRRHSTSIGAGTCAILIQFLYPLSLKFWNFKIRVKNKQTVWKWQQRCQGRPEATGLVKESALGQCWTPAMALSTCTVMMAESQKVWYLIQFKRKPRDKSRYLSSCLNMQCCGEFSLTVIFLWGPR